MKIKLEILKVFIFKILLEPADAGVRALAAGVIYGKSEDLLLKGLLRLAILSLLEKERMTGYSMLKTLKDVTGLTLHAGTVYPLLYSLERAGILTSFSVERGRRRLRYYTISEAGRGLLEKARSLAKRVLSEALHNKGAPSAI